MPCGMASAPAAPAPAGPPQPFYRTPLFAVLAITAAALLAYHNSFAVPFVFDDEPSILSNRTIRSLWQAWWPPQGEGITVSGRPLLSFTLAVNYAISGTQAWSYHAVNLLIHVAAGMVLFDVVRRTLLRPRLAPRFGAHAGELALLTAALWTLHPLQTESVTYIVQRAESLMGLLYLLTLWCFIRSVNPDASPQWSRWAFVACLLGMATKEVMVTAPLIVALYDRTFVAGSWREVWVRRRVFHLALGSTWLVLFALVLSTSGRGGTAGFGTPVTSLAYALTQIDAVAYYLRLTVWPAPLVFDYGRVLVESWREILWPALLLLLLGGAAIREGWRGSPAGFCGIAFFIILMPSSSVVPVATQTMAEHRMYLPLAAVVVLTVSSAYRFFGKKGMTVLAAAAVVLAAVTVVRNEDYASTISLYEDTVAKCPSNARAMALLANYYRQAGRLEDARKWLERSLALEPGVRPVLNNLGTVWQELGQPGKAVTCFQQALALEPGDTATLNNLGNALILSGRAPEGIAQLESALRIAPDSWATRANLANALAQSGRMPEAAICFEALLQARPDDAETHSTYGDVLMALNRRDEAIAQLAAAARLQPDDADLHVRFGTALGRAGRLREALEQFQAALRLDPTNASARQNAALAQRRLERN